MKCKNCGHEPTFGEMQSSPEACPKCGMGYREWEERTQKLVEERKQWQAINAARAKRPAALKDAEERYPGAQPVVVVDVNMSLTSMVLFMVKWAIAAIPALIILALVFTGLTAALGVFSTILSLMLR